MAPQRTTIALARESARAPVIQVTTRTPAQRLVVGVVLAAGTATDRPATPWLPERGVRSGSRHFAPFTGKKTDVVSGLPEGRQLFRARSEGSMPEGTRILLRQIGWEIYWGYCWGFCFQNEQRNIVYSPKCVQFSTSEIWLLTTPLPKSIFILLTQNRQFNFSHSNQLL